MALDRTSRAAHRVGTVRFRIDGPDETTLLRQRSHLHAIAEETLPSVLEEILDELAGKDEMLTIPRLEVDLGELRDGIPDLAEVAGALRRALRRLPPVQTASSERGEKQSVSRDGSEADQIPAPFLQSRDGAALEALIGYLLHGVLPGYAAGTMLSDILDVLPPPKDVAIRLVHALSAISPPRRQAVLIRFLAVAGSTRIDALLQVAREVSQVASSAMFVQASPPTIPRHLQPGLSALDRVAVSDLLAQALWPDLTDDLGSRDTETRAAAPIDTLPETDIAGLAVAHAGVVLVHPFLPQLFKMIGLLTDGVFVDEAAQVTAARLIHYLATGETEADEPQLMVPRLLAGLGTETPLLATDAPESGHLVQADALLEAVIGHWSKLGNTSPVGLRETFLTRRGLLRGWPERPHLFVEQRGVDVLLGALPWALTPIRLRWLQRPILVDWR